MKRNFTEKFFPFVFFLSAIFCSNFSFAQNCNTPTGLFTSGISNYSATLNWNLDSDIDFIGKAKLKSENNDILVYQTIRDSINLCANINASRIEFCACRV